MTELLLTENTIKPMAKKRMFSLKVVDTDTFLDMSSSAQNLYFHLGMRADDDGFVSSPKKIMMLCNASEDDMKVLIAKGFLIQMATNGVSVITHWHTNNLIRSDRYEETEYKEEKSRLNLSDGKYNQSFGIPVVNQTATQVRLGKVSKIHGESDDSQKVIEELKKEDFTDFMVAKGFIWEEVRSGDETKDAWTLDGRLVSGSRLNALRREFEGNVTPRSFEKKTFAYDQILTKLRNSNQKTDKIVALIWKRKGYEFENEEQCKAQFDIDKKFAAQLRGYSGIQIDRAIEICEKDSKERGYEWKASTVVKKISELMT